MIPSQSMPENVKVVNNYSRPLQNGRPPKTNSSYKIEVENPHYEMSANFAKSCSASFLHSSFKFRLFEQAENPNKVSGLAAIHKNINLSRLPTSKTNYNLAKHPSTVKESMLPKCLTRLLSHLAKVNPVNLIKY